MDEPLLNPLSGELLDPQDIPALRLARHQLEEWLGHNDLGRIPVWKASRQIQEILSGEPYGVPRASRQSEVQQKLARCPRCSTVLEVGK